MSILFIGMLIFLPLFSYELPTVLYTEDGQSLRVQFKRCSQERRSNGLKPITLVILQCLAERYEHDGILSKDVIFFEREDWQELFLALPRGWNKLKRNRGNRFFFRQTGDTRSIKRKAPQTAHRRTLGRQAGTDRGFISSSS